MDILLEGEKNLTGIDGLDEIIGYLGADGLIHDVFLLALGDHDHGCGGRYLLDALKCLQTIKSGHHLVEENKVETTFTAKVDGIVAIANGDDLIAFLFQKNDVGAQQFYLVIHPQEGSVLCHIFILYHL